MNAMAQEGSRLGDPVWHCERCHQPLSHDDGEIIVSYDEVDRQQEAMLVWHAKYPEGSVIPGGELIFGMPDAVSWHIRHVSCGSEDRGAAYGIPSEAIQTWRDVADWTAHLFGKQWFTETDWDKLLWRAGA